MKACRSQTFVILYRHVEIVAELNRDGKMLSRFEKYLRHGFYPFYTTETEQNYLVRVNNLITSVIDYDVPAVERVEYETLRKAKHLLNLVGGGVGVRVWICRRGVR